jgi:hypothetical protein
VVPSGVPPEQAALRAIHLPLTLAIAVSAPSPSWAGDAECTIVADAFARMARQQIVRQVDTRSDFPGPIEMIFTQDATYSNIGGPWKKTDLSGDVRLAQLENSLKAQPLRDCHRGEDEDVGGIQASLFRYAQRQANAPAQAVNMEVWIGKADGLPYRWRAGPISSRMEYAGVTEPAPRD